MSFWECLCMIYYGAFRVIGAFAIALAPFVLAYYTSEWWALLMIISVPVGCAMCCSKW